LGPVLSLKASCCRLCSVKRVTWWACLVRVRCAAFRNESAMPLDATSASVSAVVQPEPSKRSPRVFQRARPLDTILSKFGVDRSYRHGVMPIKILKYCCSTPYGCNLTLDSVLAKFGVNRSNGHRVMVILSLKHWCSAPYGCKFFGLLC